MTLPTTLRIDHLELENFRCFETCTADFHRSLTVIVAENGRGKTALLDAVSLSLSVFVDTMCGQREAHGIERRDIRIARDAKNPMRPCLPTEIRARGLLDLTPLTWSRTLQKIGARVRTSTKDSNNQKKAASALLQRLDAHAAGANLPPPLPVVAYYGTGRLWSTHRLTERRRTRDLSIGGRIGGYTDALSSSSSFKSFASWYEETANAARDPSSVAISSTQRPALLLAAVREATRVALEPTGWQYLDWDFDQKCLVVEHPESGRLPLDVLSDGVRNIISLVGDLAHRCVRLNPDWGEKAAQLTPGVVLIDEVDMHLHPIWQQRIVGLLQSAFPAIQLIVTTHSPHVLTAVDSESVRIIRMMGGVAKLDTPEYQTRGVESADTLAKVMGVNPSPPVIEAEWLSEYRSLLQQDQHDSPAGVDLWGKLTNHFGVDHPVLRDLEPLRRLALFKRERGLSKKGNS